MRTARVFVWIWFMLGLAACQTVPASLGASPPATAPEEVEVMNIPLAGPAAGSSAELSGLAWFGDWLVLLPQYPERFPSGPDGSLFAIPKAEILAFLDGKSRAPITPRLVPLTAPGIRSLPGYEGFEAIGFQGQSVYLTIEASPGAMQAYLVKGEVSGDLESIRLDVQIQGKIAPRANVTNMSDEALVILGDRIACFDEVNGAAVNPSPGAHLFRSDLSSIGEVPWPSIEYRVTDATPLDGQNRFWVIQYFYPGDAKIAAASDPLAQQYGQGITHSRSIQVERLVEFQWDGRQFLRVDQAPIQLQLLPQNNARNWEGLARLDDRGFLLATDSFPDTLLGFVARPAATLP